jgi:FkbM family methyltransferase
VVLELGGGIGFMSSVLTKNRRPSAYHVFEANPALIPYIHAVHAANGLTGISVTNAMLSPAAEGPRPFYVRGNFLASSMSNDLGDAEGGVIRTCEVPVLDINTELRRIRPTYFICDIEGAESAILPHADLSSVRAVVIELHPQFVGQSGVQAVFDVMNAHGLTYFPRASNGKVVLFKKDW